MTETKATYEAVKRAFESLVKAGKPTSNRAVHALTGGSLTTVGQHLGKIRAELLAANAQPEMPPAFLSETIEPMLRKVWSHAQSEAGKAYENNIAFLVSAQAGLAEDKRELEAENLSLKAQLSELSERLKVSEMVFAEERVRSSELSEALEDANRSLERTTAQHQAAESLVAHQREALEGFQRLYSTVEELRAAKAKVTSNSEKGDDSH